MAQALKLSSANFGGLATVDFMTDVTKYANLGLDLGTVPEDGGPREIVVTFWSGASSHDTLWQQLQAIEALLVEARQFRAQGLGRRVTLEVTPNGGTKSTYYDVLGGELEYGDLTETAHLVKHWLEPVTLRLLCEPYGRGAEVSSLVSIDGTNAQARSVGVTHMFLHYTGATVFSANMMALIDGSLWQSNKFTASPTIQTPQNGDILYFGNTAATFDRIIWGLRTAAVGTYTAVWEYWNGAAWTTFAPTTNSFSATRQWDTAATLGVVAWSLGDLTGWATTAVNGVTAYWVRWRISAFTSMTTVPVRCNGPVRSMYALPVVSLTAVKGDVPASAKLVVANTTAGVTLAGLRGGIATGRLTSYPPPFIVELEASDVYVPTGDITASVQTDANASSGERVDVVLNASVGATTRCLDFDGSVDYITRATTSGGLLDIRARIRVEVLFKCDTVPASPTPLVSKWNVTANRSYWLGIDQQKLRLLVSTDGTNSVAINGGTTLQPGVWYFVRFEYYNYYKRAALYLDGRLQASAYVTGTQLDGANTTPIRIAGNSSSWSTADSLSGTDSEAFLDGKIDWVHIEATGNANSSNYNPRRGSKPVVTGFSRLLYLMTDNAASTVVVDSSGNGFDGTITGGKNSNAMTQAGYYQSGLGQAQTNIAKVLGIRLPQCYGEEYAGNYRVFLAMTPASAPSSVDDLEVFMQLGVGDNALLFQTRAGRKLPTTVAPPGTSHFYLLDMGAVTLPPVLLPDGHRGSGSARDMLACHLYLKHRFVAATTIRFDCLYFLPADTCYFEWDAVNFNVISDYTYPAAGTYEIGQNESLELNALGPELAINLSSDSAGTVKTRNPYARYAGSAPALVPGKQTWLFVLPLRAVDDTVDYQYRNATDTFTVAASCAPRWRALASP